MGAVLIGTSGWHYDSWRGVFYPAAVRTKDLLAYYAGHFSTTELNASFYRLPAATTVRAWRDQTPEHFLFAWKASRYITHFRRLKDVEDSIELVFTRMAGLGPKFGPVLFQLPPQMRADRERLARFLTLLPRKRRHVVEFRHPSWYEPAILDLLRERDVALCISDHAAAPAPWEPTARHVYVRGHGPSGRYAGSYSPTALAAWASRIKQWQRQRRAIYCYFDNDQKSAAPHDARRLIELVAARRR